MRIPVMFPYLGAFSDDRIASESVKCHLDVNLAYTSASGGSEEAGEERRMFGKLAVV